MINQDEIDDNVKLSDDRISFAGDSDEDYEDDYEAEEQTDDDYMAEYEDEIEDDYTSENSDGKPSPRKKTLKQSKTALRKIHRPALKNRQRQTHKRSFDDESSSSNNSSIIGQNNGNEHDQESIDSDNKDEYDLFNTNNETANSQIQCESVEKVIKHRMGCKGNIGPKTTIYGELSTVTEAENTVKELELQFFIKWKNWSYIHSTWENTESLKSPSILGFKRVENYIKKITQKKENKENSSDDEFIEYVNDTNFDDFTTVERILASKIDEDSPDRMEYFCKWKSLGYDECTWESEDIVFPRYSLAVESFIERSKLRVPQFDQRHTRYNNYNRDAFCSNFNKAASRAVTEENKANNSVGLTLRDYQVEGVKWLVHSWFVGNSVILADEMGLGKTVQMIKYIDFLRCDFGILGPYLIIVPLTTLDSWMKHFDVWAHSINVIPFIGNAKSREIIYNYEMFDKDNNDFLKFNVLITTYELVLKEREFFSSIRWASMIIDEGHRLKNDNSQLYQALYDFDSYHRILMTGTPLQNSIRELWCLLHFIMPDRFKEYSELEKYSNYQNYENGLDELQSQISEYMLRRTKKDVEKSLPPKLEQILRVDMTLVQKRYYRWILTKNYHELSKEGKGNITGFLNILMELKKCCNHAALVCPDADIHASSIAGPNEMKILLNGSGKLILLDKLLTRLAETKSRVLIFSQMVHMLDILSEYLIAKKFGFQRLDGSMNEISRVKAIDHFNAPDSDDFCFLLSTKAGGLGINLVTADTVIIYDSDWNPQNDLQAQARAHRIGQTKQVKIYRLVTKSSIEEDIVERAKRKMVLDHLVIQTMDAKSSGSTKKAPSNINFNSSELSLILKFGAGELFKEKLEEGKEEPLQELDLDAIIKLAEHPSVDALKVPLSRGEEFLSSFKIANFKTTEAENNFFTEGLKWEDIVPSWEIEKIMHERQLLEEQKKASLPPRRPLLIHNSNIACLSEYNSNSDDDNHLSFKKDSNRKTTLNFEHLNKKDIKRFVGELKKFPLSSTRVEYVCRMANLVNDEGFGKLDEFQKLADALESITSKLNSAKSKSVSKSKSIKEIKINDVVVDILEFNLSKTVVDNFGKAVESFIKLLPTDKYNEDFIKSNFFINFKTMKPTWNNKWTKSDDALLVVGIYYHGFKNWNKLIIDTTLNLKTKLKQKNGKLVPTKSLVARVLYLSKLIPKQTQYTTSLITKTLKTNKIEANTKSKVSSSKSIDSKVKKSGRSAKPNHKAPVGKAKKSETLSSKKPPLDSQTIVLDPEITKICVNFMKPVRVNILHIESSKPEEMKNLKKDIKAVGHLINTFSSKSNKKINTEILWLFVSNFTFISSKQLKEFYNTYCLN